MPESVKLSVDSNNIDRHVIHCDVTGNHHTKNPMRSFIFFN